MPANGIIAYTLRRDKASLITFTSTRIKVVEYLFVCATTN